MALQQIEAWRFYLAGDRGEYRQAIDRYGNNLGFTAGRVVMVSSGMGVA